LTQTDITHSPSVTSLQDTPAPPSWLILLLSLSPTNS
jgi:hypothetical protein